MNAHHRQKVLDYLLSGGIISQLNGVDVAGTTCAKDYCGILRRKFGYNVKCERRDNLETGTWYKEYWIPKDQVMLDKSGNVV